MSVFGRSVDAFTFLLFSPVFFPLSPFIFSLFKFFLPFQFPVLPRRIIIFDSCVLGMRFVIQIEFDPLVVSKNESRRRLSAVSPLSALDPVIPSNARVIVNFIIRVIVVGLLARISGPGSFFNDAAGRKR